MARDAPLTRGLLLTLALTVAACGSENSSVAPSRVESAVPATATAPLLVSRVIDGDTIVVETIGTVRLIGVDTPETVDPREPVQYFGPEASAFTREMALGRLVRLDFDVERTDRFGRTLAYVYLPDGRMLNAEIVRLGYGYAYTAFPFRYLDLFVALEREAREAKRGLWARPEGSTGSMSTIERVNQIIPAFE